MVVRRQNIYTGSPGGKVINSAGIQRRGRPDAIITVAYHNNGGCLYRPYLDPLLSAANLINPLKKPVR